MTPLLRAYEMGAHRALREVGIVKTANMAHRLMGGAAGGLAGALGGSAIGSDEHQGRNALLGGAAGAAAGAFGLPAMARKGLLGKGTAKSAPRNRGAAGAAASPPPKAAPVDEVGPMPDAPVQQAAPPVQQAAPPVQQAAPPVRQAAPPVRQAAPQNSNHYPDEDALREKLWPGGIPDDLTENQYYRAMEDAGAYRALKPGGETDILGDVAQEHMKWNAEPSFLDNVAQEHMKWGSWLGAQKALQEMGLAKKAEDSATDSLLTGGLLGTLGGGAAGVAYAERQYVKDLAKQLAEARANRGGQLDALVRGVGDVIGEGMHKVVRRPLLGVVGAGAGLLGGLGLGLGIDHLTRD